MGFFDTLWLFVHLLSATLFVGTIFFWTVIIDRARKKEEDLREEIERVEGRFSRNLRPMMKVIVGLLLFSGAMLLLSRYQTFLSFDSLYAYLLSLKITLGLIAALAFYCMPQIMRLFKNQTSAHDIAHLGLLILTIFILLLAKGVYL